MIVPKRKLDWAAMIADIIEIKAITQTALAEKCGVTQQTISNCSNQTRSPGVGVRSVLRGLAAECQLKLSDYEPQYELLEKLSDTQQRYLKALEGLPSKIVDRIVQYAEFNRGKALSEA